MNHQTPVYYSEAFKKQVISDVTSGLYSKETARRLYGIKGKSSILYWIRQFSGELNRQSNCLPLSEMKTQEEKDEKLALQQRIAELERQLEDEKMRSGLWQTLVEVAEEKFGIEIKKKSGAPPSNDSKKRKIKRK